MGFIHRADEIRLNKLDKRVEYAQKNLQRVNKKYIDASTRPWWKIRPNQDALRRMSEDVTRATQAVQSLNAERERLMDQIGVTDNG